MPKKRTKQQKIRAQYHYAFPVGHSFSGIDPAKDDSEQITIVRKTADILSLYQYDPHYIVKDIRWTLMVSLIILAIQIGLYFWLR